MRHASSALALLLAAPLLVTCGGGGGGGGGSTSGGSGNNTPPANTIYIGDAGAYGSETNVFYPAALTVSAGATVTWVWRGNGHALESGDGCSANGRYSSNGVQSPGYQLSYTFATPGTYSFYCTTHCAQLMKGTITVQ